MEKIEINNFKAFKSRIALIPTASRKNLSIYGENGSGKSSIYEALRLVFYHKRMLQPFVSRGASAEVRQAEEESFFRSFNNRKPTGEPSENFNITYNGNDFSNFDSSTYQCFMLSYAGKNAIPLITALISFGGLSVIVQQMAFLSKAKVRFKYFMAGKLVMTVISFFLAFIACKIFL